METILLRFRDSIVDINAIDEHNKIADQKGYVWWGWWKKEEEPKNAGSFSKLRSKLSRTSSLTIGLFDRTTSRFFKTDLLGISYNVKTKLETPAKINTPKYYRGEKLYCWFKISKITKIEEKEFVELFGDIPTSNKTLFALPSDSTDEAIERVRISSNYILHLSDIHFGADFGFPDTPSPANTPLLAMIKDYFTYKKKIVPGLIVVSGDLTSRGDTNAFLQEAIEFLNELCTFFQISKEQIIIVPGNHDISLQKANFIDYRHERTFKGFLKEFYGKTREIGGLDKFVTTEGLKLDVLRLNSVRLRKIEEKNFGYVGWDDYKRIIEGSIESDTESIKIAILHHHLIPVPNEEPVELDGEYRSISVTVDSGKVVEGLQHYNFNLVLHGHQHVPGINKVFRGMKRGLDIDLNKGIFLIGAGSAGAKYDRLSGHMRDNSFNIIKVNCDNIEFEALTFNSSREPDTYFKGRCQM